MVTLDPLGLVNSFLSPGAGSSTDTGFNTNAINTGGAGNLAGVFPPNRIAQNVRQIIHWLIPEGPMVAMYINPQNITYDYGKLIQTTRTKGGYQLSYWGTELIRLGIRGTTGTSGIEGINVLYDIFNNEQFVFDGIALSQAATGLQSSASSVLDSIVGAGSSLINSVLGASTDPTAVVNATPQVTLGSLAATVEMYWAGEVFRGYFSSFQVTEDATNFHIQYNINFVATQKRGFRGNRYAWEKSPVNGPSDSSVFGPPHSYSFPLDTTNVSAPTVSAANPQSFGLGIFQ